ncbi:MAG: ABC transporter ATP-binding protein [Pseudomonadota bacterium]
MTTQPLIRIDGLDKHYASASGAAVTALQNISMSVEAGEFAVIVGPSGCGKTTLLRIVAGLIPVELGAVALRGNPVHGPSRDIGVVFQDPHLFPWRTVLDNVLLPAQVLRLPRVAARQRARALIELVGLTGFENRYPHELSGGMRQRAAIARALLHDPPVLLMDEPFGALDAMTREQMNRDLLEIWQHAQKTVLLITHSIAEAVFLADRVFVMTARPGRILDVIRVELPRPRTLALLSDPAFAEAQRHIRTLLGADGLVH